MTRRTYARRQATAAGRACAWALYLISHFPADSRAPAWESIAVREAITAARWARREIGD